MTKLRVLWTRRIGQFDGTILTRMFFVSKVEPGRVPDIAVIWMFALGYMLGDNTEQKEKAET